MRASDDQGRPGPHTSEAMADAWRIAGELNEHAPVEGGEWIPVRAVLIDESILPRTAAEIDWETVRRYAATFDALPPIRLEEGTLRLVGGLHRLQAAADAHRDHIRAIVREYPAATIEDEALHDNTRHGLPLSAEQRRRAAERCYARHHPDTGGTSGEAWTAGRIAEWCGVSRDWVEDRLRRDRGRAAESEASGAFVENLQMPSHRRASDDRLVPVDRAPTGAMRRNGAESAERAPLTVPALPTTRRHDEGVSRASPGRESALETVSGALRHAAVMMRSIETLAAVDVEEFARDLQGVDPREAYEGLEALARWAGHAADAVLRTHGLEV